MVSNGNGGETKWRVVFDASLHEIGAHSLNGTLGIGPNLLREIIALFLHFRLNPVAIVGDIHQTFFSYCWTRRTWILQVFSGNA